MEVVRIKELFQVGEGDEGESAYFDVETHDDRQVRVVCPHGHLGKLITYLYQSGAIAERVRAGRGAEFQMAVLNPMGLGIHAMTDGSGRVGLEFQLDQGVSILVPLPPENIAQLRKSLRIRLEQATKTAPRRQH